MYTVLGDGGKGGNIILGSEDRKIQGLTIESGGQGIDNKNGSVYVYGDEDSVISINANNAERLTDENENNQAAIANECNGEIFIKGDIISLKTNTSYKEDFYGNPTDPVFGDGIRNVSNGTATLNANQVTMDVTGSGVYNTSGQTTLNSNYVNIAAKGDYGIYNIYGEVSFNTNGNNIIMAQGQVGVFNHGSGKINVIASENADAKGFDGNLGNSNYSNEIFGNVDGVDSNGKGTTNVLADSNNNIFGSSNSVFSGGDKDVINVTAGNNNTIGKYIIKSDEESYELESSNGITMRGSDNSQINISSVKGQTDIYGAHGIYISTSKGSNVNVNAGTDINIVSHENGIAVNGSNTDKIGNSVNLTADNGTNYISVDGEKNDRAGLYSSNHSQIKLDAQSNTVSLTGKGSGNAIESVNNNSQILLEADKTNTILANETATSILDDAGIYGDKYAVNSQNGGNVDVKAGLENNVYGAVYATGENSIVDIAKLDEAGTAFSRIAGGEVANSIYSAAIIDGAGGLAGKETTTDSTGTETTTGMDVVSALYAEEGAQINLSGTNTIQTYYADTTDEHTSERAVWAYAGANIAIDGETHIKTYNYDQSPNSGDIAIAAGTATKLKAEDFTAEALGNLKKATVNLNYKAGSSIEGDILAAYGGEVHISNAAMKAKAAGEEASFDGINIHGNLLAGNTGVLNVNLGNGGRLEGRADDYGDAGTVENNAHGTTFFNPAFSSQLLTGGEVNLTMGSNSTWEVTRQSWITSVNTLGSENVVIDLTSAKSDLNEKSRALTIGEMKGDAVFSMRLDGDRSASDMLYIKNANNGKYFIHLENPVTVEDMYNGFDGLRFATVGKGSHATFSAGTYDNGVYNVEYEVGTDDYDGNKENSAYNSTNADGKMDAAKPGNALVDNLFKEEPQKPAANGIMTLAAVASPDSTDATDSTDETENMGTNTDMNGKVLNDKTNFKLIGVKSTELSDAGKTVVAMSQVNYANAIYMDRLNKRMGEARYIDGDEGLWVRIRHDRIGKSDAFRSKNTMMELGYDKRVDDREDGEHRRGFAIDYMRGTTDYHNVAGDGDVRRGGLWLYDTWLGNKGHYSDYVLKIGRLSNDFEVYARSTGEKITGDYSNFVYSASAEYGRKKDIGKDWYFEPQVQLQYAHVTDADYTTSQGTSVELDAIDSLIGRVGFRLGKDMGENNTFYVKADVLHEFLGDQDISAFDATGRLDTTYENEGTWYDVGLGFSHQFSKGTYMFLDVEKTFGNDNEDTYQFNVGMNWKV